MMNKKLLCVPFVLALAGCVDNMDSITREWRNTNNEAVDAMMMINSEEQAERMNVRIFKPVSERYKKLTNKLKIFKLNRDTNLELVKEVLESDGVHLYLTELEANSQRFSLEMIRLRHLHKHYVDLKREEMGEPGDDDPPFNPRDAAPILYDIVYSGSHPLAQVQKELTQSEIAALVKSFGAGMKGVAPKDYNPVFEKFMKKRESLGNKREIVLVQ